GAIDAKSELLFLGGSRRVKPSQRLSLALLPVGTGFTPRNRSHRALRGPRQEIRLALATWRLGGSKSGAPGWENRQGAVDAKSDPLFLKPKPSRASGVQRWVVVRHHPKYKSYPGLPGSQVVASPTSRPELFACIVIRELTGLH